MGIGTVVLNNFTVFEKIRIDASPGINVIVGQNGTGKTHLLKAIYAACRMSDRQPSGQLRDYFTNSNAEAVLCRDASKKYTDIFLNLGDNQEKVNLFASSSLPLQMEQDERIFLDRFNHRIFLPSEGDFQAVFIPVKDMLANAKGLLAMKEKYLEFPFDRTLTDIVRLASQWTLKESPKTATAILPILEKIMGGKVILENDEFYPESSIKATKFQSNHVTRS